ncbi:MAG: hypothetical protein AB2L11_03320 [Syntrophobacteraceae bacterium]
MAGNSALNCLKKRDLLNQSAVSAEVLIRWGHSFEESGMLYDAVNFYEKAKDQEALSRLRTEALNEGNVFLFKRLCHLTGHEASRDEWAQIARRAEESGKFAFAAEAFHKSGDDELAGKYTLLAEAG